jgi:hypothetical protein
MNLLKIIALIGNVIALVFLVNWLRDWFRGWADMDNH